MICSNCNTINGADSVFCVNCGNATTGGTISSMPTEPFQVINQPTPQGYSLADSTETAVVNFGQPQAPTPHNPSDEPHTGDNPTRKISPMIWIATGLASLIGLSAVGAFFMIQSGGGSGEVLPDHLGMFAQSAEKDRNDEISKQDFSKVFEAKNTLMKNDALATLDPQPSLILYADGKDIPVNDLRLIKIDSIKEDGSMKQLDFQAALVDGKPAMKRIRVPEALANGKYAFALLDGYFDDGKHKFWPFQVRNSSKGENSDALKASSLPLKPGSSSPRADSTKAPPIVAPKGPGTTGPPLVYSPPPPPSANERVVGTSNVLIRGAPSLNGPIRGKLANGQRVYVLGYTGYDCFQGRCGPWAQVQTVSGASGYVLSVLLR